MPRNDQFDWAFIRAGYFIACQLGHMVLNQVGKAVKRRAGAVLLVNFLQPLVQTASIAVNEAGNHLAGFARRLVFRALWAAIAPAGGVTFGE